MPKPKKEPKDLYSNIHAVERLDNISRDLSYLSEYICNHWPDDSLTHPNYYADKLAAKKKEIDILIAQFKNRAKEWRKRNGLRET